MNKTKDLKLNAFKFFVNKKKSIFAP
jgi:hypothetical protein